MASFAFGTVQNALAALPQSNTDNCVTGAPSAKPKVAKPEGLPNYGVVSPGIYRGAAPTTQGLATLKAMKVHTIIDLRGASQAKAEKARATAMGFTCINLPMGSEPPTTRQVATLLATLAKAPAEPVYVHCQYGADRTGCMIGIYRVFVQGWPFAQAWQEMRHYGFKPHLKQLIEAVKSRVKTGTVRSKQ